MQGIDLILNVNKIFNKSLNPFIPSNLNLDNYILKSDSKQIKGYLPRLNITLEEENNIEAKVTVAEILWGIKMKLLNDYEVSCNISEGIPVSIYESER